MSGPPGRRSRAPHQKPGTDHTIDTDSVTDGGDKFSVLDAFDLGLRLGLAYGRRAGIVQGRDDEHDLWLNWLGIYRQIVEHPRSAELEAVRNDTAPRRCSRECGNCSVCIRHAQARRNWARFRCADYPGRSS